MNLACKGEFIGGFAGVPEGDGSELMFKGVGIRAGGSSFPNLILLYCRMDQPGPSSRNVVPQLIQESPESPQSPDNIVENVPRVGVEIPLGIGLESSSEDEYEEPSSEEENNVDENNGPVNNNPPVDYGYDDDYIGDDQFTLYTRRDKYALKGWRAYVLERRSCRGFLVPSPPIPERLNLVLRAVNGVNWQKSILSGSGEAIIEMFNAAITGFALTVPRERREFLRLFGVWANSKFRAGLRDLAPRGGFLELE